MNVVAGIKFKVPGSTLKSLKFNISCGKKFKHGLGVLLPVRAFLLQLVFKGELKIKYS